jgi:hypothetical protein
VPPTGNGRCCPFRSVARRQSKCLSKVGSAADFMLCPYSPRDW